MLRVHEIKKAYGGHQALDGVTFEIGARDKVALVGINGAGKSTLLKIVAGVLPADSGLVKVQPSGTEVSYLPQDAGIRSGRTLWDEMVSAFPELTETQAELASVEAEMATAYENMDRLDELVQRQGELLERFDQLGGYRIEADISKVLAGLGFSQSDKARLCESFSGGWQMRIALARMLVRKPGLLLLDEPTNHLDLAATEWLEDYLHEYPGMIVVVSHDRYFMDRVVSRTIEVEDGVATDYRGNYSFFLAEKAKRRKEYQTAYERQQKWIKRQQDFINRFRANAARAAVVKSRERALEKLVRLAPPRTADAKITVRFAAGRPGPERVVTISGLTKRYDGRTVLNGLSLDVDRGDRIALVGPNGVGKSTLLRLIAGVETPDDGVVQPGQNVTVGYYAQDQSQTLDESKTVLEETVSAAPSGWGEESVRATLARFLFRADAVHKKIDALSGGEKSRLSLAKLILQPRQLLLLDEPTNHLDVPSKDELESALDNYPGAVLFSSHDRFLLDRVATKIVEMKDGSLELFYGGWSRYREIKAQREEDASEALDLSEEHVAIAEGQPPAAQPTETVSVGTRHSGAATHQRADGKPARTSGKRSNGTASDGKAASKKERGTRAAAAEASEGKAVSTRAAKAADGKASGARKSAAKSSGAKETAAKDSGAKSAGGKEPGAQEPKEKRKKKAGAAA
ncbi:MAG: ATP-binding cassette domain-containing protein [Chloroflexi bacterium]|nr:ATP-binding cassette domain-containing protein [Chloroflexota bacterium]